MQLPHSEGDRLAASINALHQGLDQLRVGGWWPEEAGGGVDLMPLVGPVGPVLAVVSSAAAPAAAARGAGETTACGKNVSRSLCELLTFRPSPRASGCPVGASPTARF